MIIVSNSSPLIGLALIDQLELLPALYGQIHIATATRAEVIGKGKGRPGAATLANADWLVVESVARRALATIRSRPTGLRAGEIEAIALALQLRAEKYIKAFLVRRRIGFRKTRNLIELQRLCLQVDSAFSLITDPLKLLFVYAIDIRDPDASATKEDTRDAVSAMKQVRQFVRARLGLKPK